MIARIGFSWQEKIAYAIRFFRDYHVHLKDRQGREAVYTLSNYWATRAPVKEFLLKTGGIIQVCGRFSRTQQKSTLGRRLIECVERKPIEHLGNRFVYMIDEVVLDSIARQITTGNMPKLIAQWDKWNKRLMIVPVEDQVLPDFSLYVKADAPE